jgi:hypothetical protein
LAKRLKETWENGRNKPKVGMEVKWRKKGKEESRQAEAG